MATEYKTPGVYIEEIPTLPASIVAVETAIPAFIGYTEKAEKKGTDLTLVPTRITSLLEYEKYFGKSQAETDFKVDIADTYTKGDLTDRIITITEPAANKKSKHSMYYSMQMYFNNGGGPCWIVSVGSFLAIGSDIDNKKLKDGLDVLEKIDEPTLLLFPEATGIKKPEDAYDLYESALTQCNKLKDRFTIVDVHSYDEDDPLDPIDGTKGLRGELASAYLKYGAAYYPSLKTTIEYNYDETAIKITHTATGTDSAGAAVNAPSPSYNNKKLDELKTLNNELYVNSKNEIRNNYRVILPPGTAMAGIYAAVDNDRGVWKAPANVPVTSVIAPTIQITHDQQELLNVDATSGKSVNAIRTFTGKGTLVWGARTLDGNDNEWRYVPVRRLFIMMEESIKKATEFVVFEPNDANTWTKVKAMIENFLTTLWKKGALAGVKPEHAFFVNVGLGTTMTALDILEGRLIIEIGVAAVRPAEFIILRFSHKLQQS